MANRTTYAGLAQDGNVITAANQARYPGGWVGYQKVTADQGPIVGEQNLTGLTVTLDVNANRLIKVSAMANVQHAPNVGTPQVGRAFLAIKEGVTYHGGADWSATSASSTQACLTPYVLLTPSTGSHTYYLSIWQVSGNGAFTLKASSTLPAYILVEDLGPSS